jgi:hypothetical protein
MACLELGLGPCLVEEFVYLALRREGKGNTNPAGGGHKVLLTPILSLLNSSDLLDRERKILNRRSISFLLQPEADRTG